MKRLAAIGDVHANLPALRAVLRAVRKAGLPNGVCTGDLVMRGTEPDKCVRAVRELGWPCVQGNTDRKVCSDQKPRPLDHPASSRPGSRSWTLRRMSRDNVRYLEELPQHAVVHMGRHTVVVIHGDSPELGTLVDENSPDEVLTALAAEFGADCIVTGHTHRAFVRHVGPLLLVNPGSVGEGTVDERRPAWAWIEVADDVLVAHLERVDEDLALVRDRSVHPS